MDTQAAIISARIARTREMKDEISRLKARNKELEDENSRLKTHLSLAVLAAQDLSSLPEGGKFTIIDGWNAVAGSEKTAPDRDALELMARVHAERHPLDRIWIVYDGHKRSSHADGRTRITYTGGIGPQRADRLVCDYIAAASFSGDVSRIEVFTRDKRFMKEALRLGAKKSAGLDA